MSHFTVECGHCHRNFEHPYRSGRRRIYCRRSCRQRAYEHRRHARRPHDAPLRPPELGHRHPTTTERKRPKPHNWIEGRARFSLGKLHIVVPGPPDSRHRFPTLCGTHAHPGTRPFAPFRDIACITCSRLAQRYQPPGPHQPAYDLLATQAHLINIAKALSQADQNHGGADPGTLRGLLQRSIEPIAAHLVIDEIRR